jgi:hypothetical protein
MAINASTVWEIRTTGAQTNGGGFANLVPGTSVDYSQQNSAQLSRSDIATDGAGTGISSATGGFTTAMWGNCIYITGGGTTAGWYQIVGFTSGNAVTIDRSAGVNKSGATGNVGGAFKYGGTLDSDFTATNNKAAGNKVWVGPGAYTLSESVASGVAGTVAAWITFEGYNVSRGDSPQGDNRPLINCGTAYSYTINNYYIYYNLRFNGSFTSLFVMSIGICYNCRFENTRVTAGTAANIAANDGKFIHCEAVSAAGAAFSGQTGLSSCIDCWAHDSAIGFQWISVIESVASNCVTSGIDFSAGGLWGHVIHGNVIYSCGIGIKSANASVPSLCVVTNNIITGCTTGASFLTANLFNFFDYNCWNNGANDVVNVTKGPHDITADPLLKDQSHGDFTLQANSPCINAGLQLGSIVGL